jgi:4-aminobutyrate aminotransferase/(S)-3-amino-2-methylpropionate transaminase
MSRNAELLDRRNAAVVRGVGHVTPLHVDKARNAEIWDVDGRRYIDFASGIAVLNTGHCHPKVMAAVHAQMERYTHACFQVTMYEPYVALAERLNERAPFRGSSKCIFLTTGAEATENAVKIARAATSRAGVISFTGGFHGRTALASALTGKVNPYKKGFGLPVPGIWHVPFPVPQHDMTVQSSLEQLKYVFAADVDPAQVAAIIIEPVQGEGGFHPAPPELIRALRRICDEHGIILIVDEVQTGFGRTGKLFAVEHYDVEPDLVCMAKGIAGGLPLSGVIGRAHIMDAVEPGGLGGTFAGNPLACAAALAVLDVIDEEKLLDRAVWIGQRLKSRLEQIRKRNDVVVISCIRGPGAMVGFDIVKDRDGSGPDPTATKRVVQRAYENGLILLSCGTTANTIRILAPLTIGSDVLDQGLDILEQALVCQ